MANLGNKANTLRIIRQYEFMFQKKFGQNFLIDASVLEAIVDASGITKDDFVLEIGPGIGTMTQYLCEHARQVLAVEIDKNLIPILGETLKEYDNVQVLNEDILKLDLAQIADTYNGGNPIKVVANLPYYITTPIVMELFESKANLESITIMVQKEVADRMEAVPGTKDYGALSLAVQYYSHPEVVLVVEPESFIPRPKVASTVIKLTKRQDKAIVVSDEDLLFRIIRASFNQRRKTLYNGLCNSTELNFKDVPKREFILEAIESLGVDARIRGEALTLEQFVHLTDFLARKEVRSQR